MQGSVVTFIASDATTPGDIYAMETRVATSSTTDSRGLIGWDVRLGAMSASGSTWSWAWDSDSTPYGTYYWQVNRISYDAGLLRDHPSAIRSFAITGPPTPPPDTSITLAPASVTNDSTPTFGFSANQGGAGFECAVDGGAFAPCSSPYTTDPLADGWHGFEVRASNGNGTDPSPASRSFEVDTHAPGDPTITGTDPSPPADDWTPIVHGSGAEAGSTVRIYSDADCTGPVLGSGEADAFGSFAIVAVVPLDATTFLRATATDPAGNISGCAAPFEYIEDSTPPDTTITSGPSDPTTDITPSFDFSSTETGSTFTCRIDAAPFATCSSPLTVDALADGTHTFEVRATDAAGNTDLTPAQRTFTVDTTPPDTSITSGPDGPTANAAPSFEFSSTEAGSTFACRLDAGAFADCTSPYNAATLTDGPHTFEVVATDPLGHTDLTPATRSFTVDTAAPDTTIDSGPSGAIATGDVSFGFSAEAGASFECRLDAGAWSACTSPKPYTALADGDHTFRVRAIDAAGNTDTTPATRTFTVDTAAPDTTIDSGPGGLVNNPDATFAFSSDAGATFECRLDAAAWGPCTSPMPYTGLADGDHTFRVRAIDHVGNTDPTPATRTFTVDTAAPDTTIDSGPSGAIATGDVSFDVSSEAGATFECRLDVGDWGSCTSPKPYTGLADGDHTFRVRAIDHVGNTDTTPATRSFTVDTTEPDTTIDSGPNGLVNSPDATFAFSSETGATFECRIDGAAWVACTPAKSYTALADGPHTFSVRAVDAAGNRDTAPATRTFTVDTAPPNTPQITGTQPASPAADAVPRVRGRAGIGDPYPDVAVADAWSDSVSVLLGTGDGGFAAPVGYAAGSGPTGVALADLDGDGRTDIVVANYHSGDVSILLAAGGGTFAGPVAVGANGHPESVTAGDLDRDGVADLAVPNTGSDTVSILRGHGDGSFAVPSNLPAGSGPRSVAIADFNGDAAPDLAIANVFTNDVSIYLGHGDGTFTAGPAHSVLNGPIGLATADFDGDGRADLAAADLYSGDVSVLLGNGDGTFAGAPTVGVGLSPTAISVADFNRDGDPDLAVANNGSDEVSILLGSSGGTFTAAPSIGVGSSPRSIAAADLDRDGSPDVVVANLNSDTISVLLGHGDGTFSAPVSHAAGSGPISLAVGNLNLDPGDDAVSVRIYKDDPACTDPAAAEGTRAAFEGTGVTVAVAADHTSQLYARGVDAAGNVSSCSPAFAYTQDATAPDTAIDSGPTGLVAARDASFGFSAEAGATFECRLDAGDWGPCTSPKPYTGLADGDHTFAVRATDPAGNTDTTPATRAFTVDATPPDTTITAGPDAVIARSYTTFAFSSSEAGGTFQCRLDAADWATCSSPHDATAISEGAHTFAVRAIDAVGNADPTPATRTFSVDTAAPETTITFAPASPTADPTPTFAFTASEPGARLECHLDSEDWAACRSPYTTTALVDGAHTFTVRAIDALGNADPSPATHHFTVHRTPPSSIVAWGDDSRGEASPPTGKDYVAVTAGDYFSVALRSNGSLVVWGDGSEGRATPPTGTDFAAVAAGGYHAIALRNDGSLAAWGRNVDGQATVPAGHDYVAIAAGPYHSLALHSDGTIAGWGWNDYGQATPPSDAGYVAIAAGAYHSIALRSDGSIAAWGDNAYGQATPPSGTDYVAIGAGAFHGVALRADGSVVAWGRNEWGQAAGPPLPGPYTAIGIGMYHDLALTGDGHVVGWGLDNYGQAAVPGDPGHVAVAGGWRHSLALIPDETAPDTTIDSGPSGLTASADAAFAFRSSETRSTFECRIDGAGWSTCTSPRSYTGLSDGDHTFSVRATDAAGNTDTTPATRSFTVDTAAPETTIDSGPSGLIATRDVTFGFSSEAGATLECRIDGAGWSACTSPRSSTGLSDGDHTFSVRATDAAGNTDTTPATRSFTVDTTPPTTTIDSGPSGLATSPDAGFGFSSESGATFECRLDGAAWGPCTSPVSFSGLSDGDHTFSVRATDAAGNTDTSAAHRTFTIDTVAPDTGIDAGPGGVINTTATSFTFSSPETGVRLECRLDDRDWRVCSSPQDYTGLSDGDHVFAVRAVDLAGNADPTPAQRSFTVDTSAPDTAIDSGPSGAISSPSASFTFSSPDAGATFECRLDGGGWSACLSPQAYTNLPDGTHTFSVRAIDAAGNVDLTPAGREFTVDTSIPETTIAAGPEGLINSSSVTFDLRSSEHGGHFHCRLDDGAWSDCTGLTFTGLADGQHVFWFRSVDAAGNEDPTPASRTFTIDTGAPDTQIDAGPSGTTAARDAVFSFSSAHPGARFECALDGAPWSACTSPHAYAGLSDGPHTFAVRGIDPAGNVDPTPATRTFSVGSVTPPPGETIRGDEAFVTGSSNDVYLACTKLDLLLVDVLPSGRARVSITGAADLRLRGRAVTIYLDGKRVGRTKVTRSGAFAVKVRAPSRARRPLARYQARSGKARSQRLKLQRRMVAARLTRRGNKLTLTGRLMPPFAKHPATIGIQRYVACHHLQKIHVRATRPARNGRFKVTFVAPKASVKALMYRAWTKVPLRAGGRPTQPTYTLPRAIDVKIAP